VAFQAVICQVQYILYCFNGFNNLHDSSYIHKMSLILFTVSRVSTHSMSTYQLHNRDMTNTIILKNGSIVRTVNPVLLAAPLIKTARRLLT